MKTETGFDDLRGRVCAMTGGAGIIGRALGRGLAAAGVRLAVIDLDRAAAGEAAEALRREMAADALGVEADVLDRESLRRAREEIGAALGPVDLLVNCAGGNSARATTAAEFVDRGRTDGLDGTFFGLDLDAFKATFDLNVLGTVLPTMVLTRDMAAAGRGAVLNISSMNAFRPLTRIPAYSAAKAAVNNFTAWLAAHLAKANVRVNAIAPGFFLTNQNRFLLTDERTGGLTARGQKILEATPMGKFGRPDDLIGAALFLLSDLSSFVTGVVLPVDGGFNAYSGV